MNNEDKVEEKIEKEDLYIANNQDKVDSKEDKKNKIKKEILEWVFCIIIAYVIYLFINYFIGSVSGVKQTSMTPTAVDGDRLLLQRTVLFKKELNRGDIITFVSPDNIPERLEPVAYTLTKDAAKASYDEKNIIDVVLKDFLSIGKVSYVKRVIGLSGDKIYINDKGEVYLNDAKLDEPYLNDGKTDLNGRYVNLIVPEGYIYVMGDNRLHSMDSRFFGCIPIEVVDGYVITRIWPFNKLGKLK